VVSHAILGCLRLLSWQRWSARAVALVCAAVVHGRHHGRVQRRDTPASAVVVGIGDSVTAATNCGCPGFVEPYAKDLPTSAGGPARGVNLGANGLTAAGLLKLVTTPTPTADGVAQADTLLVTIGANDLLPLLPKWRASGCPAACYSPAVDAVGSDISGILAAAKSLRGSKPIRILVTSYWNVFADGDVASASETPAYLAWSDELTRALNSRICTAARRRQWHLCRPVRTVQGQRDSEPDQVPGRRRGPPERRRLRTHHLCTVEGDASNS
jgi:lysophospholipase L1-like esterase